MRRVERGGFKRRWPWCMGAVVLAAAAIVGLWHAPPGWLLPAHRDLGRVFHWIHDHWLNAVAITAAATTAAIAVPFLVKPLDRRLAERDREPRARERAIMIRRVRYKWINGVLEPSLAGIPYLRLGLRSRADVLRYGRHVTRRSHRGPHALPPEATVSTVFDSVSGGLLVLGAVGAGKTTMLLELARELLTRAECDPAEPIPVVFNLASWTTRRAPLHDWLVGELAASYKVPGRTAAAWVRHDALTLLLDGLDEVAKTHRMECAEAISAYRRSHGLVPIAVCSRIHETGNLAAKLGMDEAVEILPPTSAEIDRYVSHLETTGVAPPAIHAVLCGDQAEQALLGSPLMLNIIMGAHHGGEVFPMDQLKTSADHHQMPWAAYIQRMFEQRPLASRCRYTQEQAIIWLGWLAFTLRDRDIIEFDLDRITTDWLPALHVTPRSGADAAPRFIRAHRHQAEKLRWRPLDRADRQSLTLIGTGVAISLYGLVVLHSTKIFLPALGMCLFQLFFMLSKNVTAEERAERKAPNEGIRWSARNALLGWLIAGTVCGLATWLQFGTKAPFLILGIAFGAMFALGFGGWGFMQHYAVRLLLARSGCMPLRYASFLDAMTERQLVRRAGSAYIFAHQQIRDYLADTISCHLTPGKSQTIDETHPPTLTEMHNPGFP
jgi:hypothetical protein